MRVSVLTCFMRFQPMNDFTILILPGAFASSVAVTLDMMGVAASIAARQGLPRPRWRVCSATGEPTELSSGMRLQTSPLPRRAGPDASVWIVPGLGTDSPAAVTAKLATQAAGRAVLALQAHARRGGSVAASCSAVFLLQAAGLLAGRQVTTSWWLASELSRREPTCVVDADRMVCVDGPVTTAGAALAQADLMLLLLRQRLGAPLADAVSRYLLIDGRQAQAPFIIPAMLASGNALVATLTARIERALPGPPSIGQLAGELGMSQRTLARHVKAATGKSTLALIQSVRLSRARCLLETSRLPIDQVAERVGYGDATALRRLMRKMAGANPSHFRTALW